MAWSDVITYSNTVTTTITNMLASVPGKDSLPLIDYPKLIRSLSESASRLNDLIAICDRQHELTTGEAAKEAYSAIKTASDCVQVWEKNVDGNPTRITFSSEELGQRAVIDYTYSVADTAANAKPLSVALKIEAI